MDTSKQLTRNIGPKFTQSPSVPGPKLSADNGIIPRPGVWTAAAMDMQFQRPWKSWCFFFAKLLEAVLEKNYSNYTLEVGTPPFFSKWWNSFWKMIFTLTKIVVLRKPTCNKMVVGLPGYIYGPASLGTPPPHPMVMGLHSSAPVPPSPPVVWVVWVVVGGGGGGRSCTCMYMNVYVWYECIFLVFVYDYDMICIWYCSVSVYVYANV